MNGLNALLAATAVNLESLRVGWALIGGLAVSVRTEPRFTRDIDIAIATEGDETAEGVARSLQGQGYLLEATVEQDRAGRLATVRLRPPAKPKEGVVLDLLFASSGIESEIVEEAQALEVLQGTRMPVARTGHLIVMKLLSASDSRPQDMVDLNSLVEAADEEELELARRAAALITERGYHRNRDLTGELERRLSK